MNEKLKRLIELMPVLRRYSIVLLTYLIITSSDEHNVGLKHSYIMQQTGLCQRSLQLAITELESMGILEREGFRYAMFTLHL